MTVQRRVELARWANKAGAGVLPVLSASSSRLGLIRWLATNDRNGTYTDDDSRMEGKRKLSKRRAWQALQQVRESSEGR
jgi:hypothetical protein